MLPLANWDENVTNKWTQLGARIPLLEIIHSCLRVIKDMLINDLWKQILIFGKK